VLKEVERLSTEDLAASFTDADRNPPVFDQDAGTVRLPASFLKSYQAYADGGWDRIDLPESLGGIGAPPTLRWAVHEMVLGANPAVYMFGSGAGSPRSCTATARPSSSASPSSPSSGQWGGTMVLTEPDAGSDVGAGERPPTCRRTAPGTSAA
jgi:alkylation response protein AidB-like acyl-CoA dehydrogenase